MSFRFGKLAPKRDYRTLRFKKYLTAKLPAPPPNYDALSDVYKNLSISNPQTLFPMDGNDTYGDCTIAALAHAITVFRGRVKQKKIWSTKDATKLYFKLSGGADSGLNELDVLNYWQSQMAVSDRIFAFTSIDRRNHTHIKQAIQLFGAVYLGFQVQKDCMDDFNAGKAWTPGPLLNEGHAVLATGYDQKGVTVLTWGNTQKGTWAWWDECVDEAYAVLPSQAKKSDFHPGFDFNQLKADLNDVAN
jgi:hypothetical protein